VLVLHPALALLLAQQEAFPVLLRVPAAIPALPLLLLALPGPFPVEVLQAVALP
jgi:hypothetical protein